MSRFSLKLTGILGVFLAISGISSCEKLEDTKVFPCRDTGTHYLQIVPENPTSSDRILAIDSICGSIRTISSMIA